MALVNNTTLTGQIAQEIYGRIWYDAPTLKGTVNFRAGTYRNGHVMIMPNIKNTLKVPILDTTSGLQPRGCVLNATGNFTLSDKVLSPCGLGFKKDVCNQDFEGLYDAQGLFQQRPGAGNAGIPPELMTYFMQEHGGAITEHAELLLWQGDTETIETGPNGEDLTLCDGWLIEMRGGTDPATLVPGAAPLTVDNIREALQDTFLALNPRMHQWHQRTGEGRIFLSPQSDLYLRMALGLDYVNNPLLSVEDGLMLFSSWPIVVTYGMPDNVIVMTVRRNLWAGTDLVSDVDNIQIISLKDTIGDDITRFVGSFKIGTQYFRGDYIALYDAA